MNLITTTTQNVLSMVLSLLDLHNLCKNFIGQKFYSHPERFHSTVTISEGNKIPYIQQLNAWLTSGFSNKH